MLLLHLTEFESSLVQLLLVFGAMMVLPYFVDPQKSWHRAGLFAIAGLLGLRYAWWRATETLAPPGFTIDFLASGSLLIIEMVALLGSISAFVLMSRFISRSDEADANLRWWVRARPGTPDPRVAILIATYNEDIEVLERTIVGARTLRYANKEVIVLDDGRRDWLRDYCAEQGVRYMIRPDNKGSKAGNINHALQRLAEDPVSPEFIAVLDADFVPHRGFLSRSLALFHDPRVGLVQTPQHFFNPDPIQHNLGLSRSYPDEQRFFFDHMQASRDAWGLAICCGTSSVARWSALQELGGFPTESVTEDFMLTMALQERGWTTVYLNEALTEGLAPEGLKEYVTQRARWCLGLMQIARSRLGPFGRNGLRLRDRWSVIDSVLYWSSSFVFRLAALTFPLLYWFANITVVDAAVPDVISYFAVYYFWTISTQNLLSKGLLVPVFHDVSQTVGALPITRAAFTGLLKPHGHPFSVTAKGGDRSKIVIQWTMMRPFLILFALTVLGLVIGIFSDRFAFYDAGDGKAVVLFWTVYNLLVLAVTMLACVELPRREQHIADEPELALMHLAGGGGDRHIWITSLTRDTVKVRGQKLSIGDRGVVEIPNVGPVEAYVIAVDRDIARLQLLPGDAEREALLVKFHAEDNVPGVGEVSPVNLIRDFLRRLSMIAPAKKPR